MRNILRSVSNYRWNDSIRPITKEVFDYIVQFCSKEDWGQFINEESHTNLSSKRLEYLVKQQESENLEFKSSMRKPTKPSKKISELRERFQTCNDGEEKNKLKEMLREAQIGQVWLLEHGIIKTIAAFMNSHGGILLIGVEDDNTVSGIEKDFETFKDRKNIDGWLQYFKNLVCNYIDRTATTNMITEMVSYDGKTVAEIEVQRSFKPKYVSYTDKDGRDIEEFYIRNINTTDQLSFRQAIEYIKERWREG